MLGSYRLLRQTVDSHQLYTKLLSEQERADRKVEAMIDIATRRLRGMVTVKYPEFDRIMYVDARLWLPDDLLTKVDRATMASSLEARVPYLDHRFFEFCARLDPALKQRGRTGKYLLKRLAEKLLPMDVVHRPKQGFMPPLAEWFRGALQGEARSAFARLTKRGLFQPAAIERLAAAARPSDAGRQWALLVLERWFQRYAPQYAL